MSIRPKLRNAALIGAIAAVATAAWATSDGYSSSYVPAYRAESQAVIVRQPLTLSETLSPNETVVIYSDSPTRDSIVVEQRRLTQDERIQSEVMDRIATNSRLSGNIGVTSRDSVVTLSGWTRTVGQARSAERDARSVLGVKYVQNEIRARVGGSV